MPDSDVGLKIGQIRRKKNMSIRELSEKTNVTSSLLSQIERGLANPSLNTLKVLSKALDEPLFSFFLQPVNTKDLILKENERKRLIFPEKECIEYQLLSPDLSGNIEMVLLKIPPNIETSDELTEHEGEEINYIVEGELVLYLDNSVQTISTGDSVKIPPFMKHKFVNQTDKTAVVIFAVSPPSF